MSGSLLLIITAGILAVSAVDVQISPYTSTNLPHNGGYPTSSQSWNCICPSTGKYRVELKFTGGFNLMAGDYIELGNPGTFKKEQFTFINRYRQQTELPDHVRSFSNSLNVYFYRSTAVPTAANQWKATVNCVETKFDSYLTTLGDEEGLVSWSSKDIANPEVDYVNVLLFQSDGLLKNVFDETFLYVETLTLNTNNSVGIYTIAAGKTAANNVESFTNTNITTASLVTVSAPTVAVVVYYDSYNNGSRFVDTIGFKYLRTGQKLNHLSANTEGKITMDTCNFGQVGKPDSGSVAYSCKYYVYSADPTQRILVTPNNYQLPPGTIITIRDGWVDKTKDNLLAQFGWTDNDQSKDRPVLSYGNLLVVSVQAQLVNTATMMDMNYQVVSEDYWKSNEICKSPTPAGTFGLLVSNDYSESAVSKGLNCESRINPLSGNYSRFTVLRYHASGTLTVKSTADLKGIQKTFTESNFLNWPETFSFCVGPVTLSYTEPKSGTDYGSFEVIWEQVDKDNTPKACSQQIYVNPDSNAIEDKSQLFPCTSVAPCSNVYITNSSYIFQISILENLIVHGSTLKISESSGNKIVYVSQLLDPADDVFHSTTNEIKVDYSGSMYQNSYTAGYRIGIKSMLAADVINQHTTTPKPVKPSTAKPTTTTSSKDQSTTSSNSMKLTSQNIVAMNLVMWMTALFLLR